MKGLEDRALFVLASGGREPPGSEIELGSMARPISMSLGRLGVGRAFFPAEGELSQFWLTEMSAPRRFRDRAVLDETFLIFSRSPPEHAEGRQECLPSELGARRFVSLR